MEQLSFLGGDLTGDAAPTSISDIEGLRFIPDFVSEPEERRLLEILDASHWLPDLKRRVQHYGYKYDYTKRNVDPDDFLGPLPQWAVVLSRRLLEHRIFTTSPDQVIVNEYLPGQGIAPHIDRETCFGEDVASLSLGAFTIMDFVSPVGSREVPLPRRSLVALSGPARHFWRHGIAARRSDKVGNHPVPRDRRVSLTFRTIR